MTRQKLLPVSRWMLLLVCCVGMSLSGCKIVVDKLADTYSGEALFEGIFRGNGDILGFDRYIQDQVHSYLETDRQKEAFLKFEKELVSKIAKDHPDFVLEFYTKLHSNNREKVKEALEDAGKLVEKELQELTGEDEVTAEGVVKYALGKYDVDEE